MLWCHADPARRLVHTLRLTKQQSIGLESASTPAKEFADDLTVQTDTGTECEM